MNIKDLEKDYEQKIENNKINETNNNNKIIEDLISIYEEFNDKEKNNIIDNINNKLKKYKIFEKKEKLINKKYEDIILLKKEKLKKLTELNNITKNKLLEYLNKKSN